MTALDPRAEPMAYMHPNGAIWRADNYPAGMDFSKNGWIALYAPQPALAVEGLSDEAMETAVQVGRKAFFDYRGDESAISVGIRAALEAAALVASPPPSGAVEAETYYTKGKDAEYFEMLSDKDFAWEATKMAQDLADMDTRGLEDILPFVGVLSVAASRIAALTATTPATADGWREDRLPTHEEFKTAMAVIFACNGFDLSQWTDDIWPDEGLETVAKYMRQTLPAAPTATGGR